MWFRRRPEWELQVRTDGGRLGYRWDFEKVHGVDVEFMVFDGPGVKRIARGELERAILERMILEPFTDEDIDTLRDLDIL
jgi:hypothetical protein